MNNPLKGFFYFRKSDRKGIVALGCIAVFALGVLMVLDRMDEQKGQQIEPAAPVANHYERGLSASQKRLHAFDPNTVDSLTLIQFGIKPWKVKNFLHYRAAGKVFHSAEDLGDTYGWTAEDIQCLSPYVRVKPAYQIQKDTPHPEGRKRGMEEDVRPVETKKFQTLTKVDVNEADTSMLRRIPGVGEKISVAIVRYRQRLGGFHSVEQLREISIVSPELLEWLTVSSPSNVQKINLNKASFQALNSHPYISYEQTKSLLQYIRLYGEVKSEEALMRTGIFTKEEAEKIRPYIAYE